MPLQASGEISLNDIHLELSGASGTQVSLNDTDVRSLISSTAGTEVSLDDFYGASLSATINLTISSNTNNYNIWSNKGGSYVAGASTINLTINSGVTVGSSSTGSYALDTGTGWSTGDTINIINNGAVKGRGGNGGRGASNYNTSTGGHASKSNAANGATGGNAFRAQFACSITNNGSFSGGGGGGGGGGSHRYYENDAKLGISFSTLCGGGGGGGAGVNASSGGSGGTAGSYYKIQDGNTATDTRSAFNGSTGGSSGGGAGGLGLSNSSVTNVGITLYGGGNGGGLGSSGAAGSIRPDASIYFNTGSVGSGGGAGKYAVGNSNITWTVTGTRQGGVA